VAPIDTVENWGRANNKLGCIITVAPREMPVFQTPFDSNPVGLKHYSGFDFARAGVEINTQIMGTGNLTKSTLVDHRGRDHTSPPDIDDHSGHDWPIQQGEPIRAVADGVVVLRQTFTVPANGCPFPMSNPNQREVYILHTVETPEIGVRERFISYYAHLNSYAAGVTTGTTVTRGTTIGTAGSTGCSTESHLHLGVFKLTNTANALEVTLPATYTRNWLQSQQLIDPYGWAVTCGNHGDCVDPWGHKAFPSGALSSNLWMGAPPLNTNF
jgi:murein DD-endopeptidase MepM/ murein hydrolase activator NlpD